MKTSAHDWQERYDDLRQRERHALLALLDGLAGADAREEMARLQDAVQHLSGLFCLAVIGEFNAGKSSLLNALLGARLLPEGITPTTATLHLVTYGPTTSSVVRGDGLVEWTHPAPWLKDIYLVDTPGSNTIFQQHETRARSFLHRADMLFFVISAKRALAESDRLYLDLLRDYGAKIVIILNQIDLLKDAEEVAEVSRFVLDKVRQLLGQPAPFFAVSAKWALQAAESKDEAERISLEARSGMAAVWEYIEAATAERQRARQQLLTSLRVGAQIAAKQKSLAETRLAEWRQEGEALAGIRAQIAEFQRHAEEQQLVSGERLSTLMSRVTELAQANLSQDYGLGRVFRELGRFVIRLPFAAAAPREAGDLALGSYLRAEAPREIAEEWRQTELTLRKEGQILLAGVAERANKRVRESPTLREKIVGETRSVDIAEGAGAGLQEGRREIEEALDAGGLLAFVREWSQGARNAWWRTVIWEIVVILLALALSYYVKTFVEADARARLFLWIVGGAAGLGVLGLCWLPLRRVFARRGLARALDKTRVKLAAAQKSRIESLTRRYMDAAETALSPYSRATASELGRLGQSHGRLAEIEGTLRDIESELARDDGGV